MRHRLEAELWVPAPIDEVWAFAMQPENLARISPPSHGLTIRPDGPFADGVLVHIDFAPLGVTLPFSWKALISNIKNDGTSREFTDTQQSGPLRFWKHRHRFEAGVASLATSAGGSAPTRTPGTWMIDTVDYELPVGAGGDLVHKLFARKAIEDFFAYRRARVAEIFGGDLSLVRK